MFPRFDGVIGLVGFLILAYLLFSKSSGAEQIFNSLASGSTKLISTLQGR
jgi:hypothetical protein